jgi:predicted helicase
MDTAEEKLSWLGGLKASDAKFEVVKPDKRASWINQDENNWDDMIPVADKKTKAAKTKSQERAVFKEFSTGMMTGRDDWVYDKADSSLERKMRFFSKNFHKALHTPEDQTPIIKLSRNLKRRAEHANFERDTKITTALFRPFVSKPFFLNRTVIDEWGAFERNFSHPNTVIGFLSVHSTNLASTLAAAQPFDYGLLKNGNGGTQALYRHRYTPEGEKIDNITDWALNKFTAHYGKAEKITKDDIFAYVYAVLHDPIYRETYAINLKREFPRIPFYPAFKTWRDWGQALLDLHIGYESVTPWPLTRTDIEDTKATAAGLAPKAKLKADTVASTIELDSETTLSGIPPECWAYKLGNRSGLEWVLDQYKEKTPRDPTVAAKFNTYRFADYKDHVIDLLGRVAHVSVETMKVTEAMKALKRK